jgi:AraC-like DNA-binding protein
MTDADLRRLSELRALMEGFAARHAAVRAPAEADGGRALLTVLERLSRALRERDYAAFRAADHDLHRGIASLAGVPGLLEAWEGVWERQSGFHRRTFEQCWPDARFLIEEHANLVETVIQGDPAAAEDAARSHVEAVWYRVAESGAESGADAGGGGDALQRAAAHLAFSLARPLRLEEVASKVAFTSAGNLSRLFRSHFGMGFQAYLQKLRMDKAAELLRATRLPVARVARRVGYRDVSRFGQHFKRAHGEAPSRWRGGADAESERAGDAAR